MHPTDQYLAPFVPGFRDLSLYPLHGDVARARRLAGASFHGHADLLTLDFAPQTRWAAIVRANLAKIGIDVTIEAVPVSDYSARVGSRDADYDMAFFGWFVDFPDPHNVLNTLLRGNHLPPDETHNDAFFDEPAYNRRLDAAARPSGPPRYAAYAKLDADLAGKESRLMAIGIPVQRDYFSARVGCQVFEPATGGMDLTALCPRRR